MTEEPTGDRDRLVDAVARHFHETYERLAPGHGWESRTKDVAFEDLPEPNRSLMRETVAALLDTGVIEVGPALLGGFRPKEQGDLADHWGATRAPG